MVKIHEEDKKLIGEIIIEFLEHTEEITSEETHFEWNNKVLDYLNQK